MTKTIALIFGAASLTLAQPDPKQLAVAVGGAAGMITMNPVVAVKGAPYSATVVNESIQTLSDGNRIVQNTTGFMARDSQGRTRQTMALPPIGNLSAANAPQLVFIQDPVAQTAYRLNLTDKTAHKTPLPPSPAVVSKLETAARTAVTRSYSTTISAGPGPGEPSAMVIKAQTTGEPGEARTEDLGTQTMQGIPAHGVRTTRTIAAGQIGNDKPIDIVTEVWTSPDLQTIVYSKRSDPRTGEQTFQLNNIVRSEPDPSQFTVPSDFKLADGPDGKGDFIFYRPYE
jgi:hypothetical protein